MAYTVSEIAGIVHGKLNATGLSPNHQITQISTDSRTILNAGDVAFFALNGPRNNGHLFIGELAEKGVRVFVISDENVIASIENCAFIIVRDTLEALQQLATFHRRRFSHPVIGITGSNGKTVVKEWLSDILSKHFSIVRSPKSYNSQTGVPLSVWNIREGHTLAIFEAGISMPGEMEKLEKIIAPTIGIFTNIGDAHQEHFRNLQHKIEEKIRLFIGSEMVIIRVDQPEVEKAVKKLCQTHKIKIMGWSLEGRHADVQFSSRQENGFAFIDAVGENLSVTFSIPMGDSSSIENACHCFMAALALGVDPASIVPLFTELAPLSMRLELKRGINSCLLLNDYYNSDINSLEIAISVLNRQAEKNHLEKIVILSDIRQSGLPAAELYSQVNRLLTGAGVKKIIGIGHNIQHSGNLFSIHKQFYPSTESFLAEFKVKDFANAAILIKGARDFRFEEVSAALQLKAHQTILEINLNALVENLNIFRSLLHPGTKTMVMVKAFSYGSGDVEIAKLLQYQRVDYLAVAVTDEGKDLRNAGITLPIIVMNPESHSFQQMIDYRLEPNLYSIALAGDFARAVDHNALDQFPVHLKIDTGMNRLGLKSEDEMHQMAELCRHYPQLRVQSIFSHLAASDDPSMDSFTLQQIRRFEQLGSIFTETAGYPVIRHILNSAGIERFREYQYGMVRLGIGLYGVSATNLPLHPISRLKSTVSQVKSVLPEETVGYNRSGRVKCASQIAVIPIGYADGLDRRLGNGRGSVFIRGERAPIIGNICMDMCMVDVTGLGCISGDEAEIFGEHISVQEVAKAAETIPYEILTGISQRVKRIYIQD